MAIETCPSCKKPRFPKEGEEGCRCAAEGKGAKFDEGKLDWTLFPIEAMEGVVRIMNFGAKKYARDNWKTVDNAIQRYSAAFWRHFIALHNGETFDPDSGEDHWWHMMTNLTFISFFKHIAEREGKIIKVPGFAEFKFPKGVVPEDRKNTESSNNRKETVLLITKDDLEPGTTINEFLFSTNNYFKNASAMTRNILEHDKVIVILGNSKVVIKDRYGKRAVPYEEKT